MDVNGRVVDGEIERDHPGAKVHPGGVVQSPPRFCIARRRDVEVEFVATVVRVRE